MSLAQITGLDLIAPAEAVDQICEQAGSRYQARVLVADAIHNGDVLVYAEKVYELDDALPTDEWNDLVGAATLWGEFAEVGADIWDGSYFWPDETRYWDWSSGNFLLNHGSDLTESFSGLLFEGVKLERQAVLAVIGRSVRSGAGGRRSDREKWAEFWVAFIKRLADRNYDFSKFQTKRELSEFMVSASGEIFSEQGIRFAVDKVWSELVTPHK